MATATKDPPKPKKIHKYVLKIPVNFKNLSVGDATTTLGFSVIRDRLNIDSALEAFCGKRLAVCLLVGAGDPDQGVLWDDAQYRVDGVADAKKFSVTPKLITSGLCFNLEGTDVLELTHFAKREGTLLVVKVGDVPAEGDGAKPADEDEPEDDEDAE